MNYLDAIKNALTKFYQNDSELLDGKTHEMTFCFRIAMYLTGLLEGGEKRIDCEYHGQVRGEHYVRKAVGKKNIRPDIIFHQRSSPHHKGSNIFAVEVKLGSPAKDMDKMRNILNVLNYEQGFCISNVSKRYVTVHEVFADDSRNSEKHRDIRLCISAPPKRRWWKYRHKKRG